MDAVDRAFEYYKNFKEKHPHLKEEVEDLYYLFLAEIEDECASKQHEYELFVGSCEELLEEENEEL